MRHQNENFLCIRNTFGGSGFCLQYNLQYSLLVSYCVREINTRIEQHRINWGWIMSDLPAGRKEPEFCFLWILFYCIFAACQMRGEPEMRFCIKNTAFFVWLWKYSVVRTALFVQHYSQSVISYSMDPGFSSQRKKAGIKQLREKRVGENRGMVYGWCMVGCIPGLV